MNMTVEQAQGTVPVTILALQGQLDASNYQDLVAQAKELYNTGTRNLLLDLSQLSFMSSSGLAALHMTAVLMRGEEPPDPEYGWDAFHAIDRDRDSGKQRRLKLLNPQPPIERTLKISGLDQFFEVHRRCKKIT